MNDVVLRCGSSISTLGNFQKSLSRDIEKFDRQCRNVPGGPDSVVRALPSYSWRDAPNHASCRWVPPPPGIGVSAIPEMDPIDPGAVFLLGLLGLGAAFLPTSAVTG